MESAFFDFFLASQGFAVGDPPILEGRETRVCVCRGGGVRSIPRLRCVPPLYVTVYTYIVKQQVHDVLVLPFWWTQVLAEQNFHFAVTEIFIFQFRDLTFDWVLTCGVWLLVSVGY